MRILQVIQRKQLRGAEIFACQLATELKKQGSSVDILYLFDGNAILPGFDLHFIPLHANARRRFWDIAALRRLARIITEGKYDIVQANAGDTLKYAAFSRCLFRWKANLIFRNASHMSDFMRGHLHRMFNRWLLRQCQWVISVSENSRQDLIRFYLPAALSSVTIPIGTKTFEGVPAVPGKGTQHEPVFINIGSFVFEKNHIFLLEVFSLYYRQNGKGILWLIGDGKLRPELEERITQLAITDRVQLWGYRSDVISILKSADILIMPSLIEGLPGVILEAISCEVPVIASAVGGIPEIIEDGVTGICIDGWAAKKYVDGMTALLDDPDHKKRLVECAKAKLLDQFTIEKVSSRFLKVYQNLLEHGSIRN